MFIFSTVFQFKFGSKLQQNQSVIKSAHLEWTDQPGSGANCEERFEQMLHRSKCNRRLARQSKQPQRTKPPLERGAYFWFCNDYGPKTSFIQKKINKIYQVISPIPSWNLFHCFRFWNLIFVNSRQTKWLWVRLKLDGFQWCTLCAHFRFDLLIGQSYRKLLGSYCLECPILILLQKHSLLG